jgi:3-oxoacyl-[acyl-carrier protein] reductase
MKMKEEDFASVVNTNLTGSFLCSQKALKIMARQKSGSIINVSSVIGVFGNAGQVNYAASKAGLIGMTKSYAKEYGKRGIRVNAIAPGFIETDMTDDLPDSLKDGVKTNVALARFGTPEEVAKTIYFLGSEEGSYITGQTILVDGGM